MSIAYEAHRPDQLLLMNGLVWNEETKNEIQIDDGLLVGRYDEKYNSYKEKVVEMSMRLSVHLFPF